MLNMISVLLLVLLCTILICGVVLYYRKFVVAYYEFPKIFYFNIAFKCILMSLYQHIPITSSAMTFIIEVCKRFQSEGLCLFLILQPYLFVYGEEAMKIFSNESTTINKPFDFDLFKVLFKESLLTSGDNLWRKRRKMLNPIFYSPNLKDKPKLINKNAKRLAENILKYNKLASSDVKKFLKECAFRNVYEFITGSELSENENNVEVKELIECINEITEMIAYRMSQPWLHLRCLLPLFPKGRSYLKTAEKCDQLLQKMYERVIESAHTTTYENEKEIEELGRNSRRSFGQVIINHHAKDLSYTSENMLGEASGLLVAGYDTVSYALMWNLFLLGHHPDVQEQVYEEVESVMGSNGEILTEDLQNLKYLECVIKESLRLYPPVPLYAKRTIRNVKCGKYTVPKGTNIVFLPYMAHRDPTMFPVPEKFDPERFLEENSDKKLFTYSFSEGIRNCIGKNFAMMELKIVLAHLIKNFKVTSLDRREDIKLSWEIILTTVEPLRMQFTPRRHISIQG